MKLSQTFVRTLREVDESSRNAELLIRAGYIHKELAGVYDYLPLGLKVLENIKTIIREELNSIGCEELQLTTLQNPEPWQKSGRWESEKMDIWFKTELSAGGELGLAPTHEEPITNLMRHFIKSYKDLPVYAYQFQTKFRNELRAKSGILRGREFLMKDLYSFSTNEEEHNKFYHAVEEAYRRIYARVGLGDCTYETFASGGVFAKYSHEFQTILPVGEDTIYYNQDKSVVLNEEVLLPEVLDEFGIKKEDLTSTAASEVGNIFTLKFKYSEPLGLNYTDQAGKENTVFMGSYGIGVSRVMGVIVEKYADDKGIIWPESIAPYRYYLIGIGAEGTKKAAEIYATAPDLFIFDDRDVRPGEKFADADLLGIPYRVVVSDKSLAEDKIELKNRQSGNETLLTVSDFYSKL